MDPVTIGICICLGTLFVDRFFDWAIKIKKSKCFNTEIEMKEED